VNSYDPSLKFSGKEHDEESGLDYFGRRYYDKVQYRFISIDPICSRNSVCFDPQLLNLYSYSRDNPISYFDPDGAFPVLITIVRTGVAPSGGIMGTFTVETPFDCMSGKTLEPDYLGAKLAMTAESGSAIMAGIYIGTLLYDQTARNGAIIDTIGLSGANLGNRTNIWIHNGTIVGHTTGCILVGFNQNPVTGGLSQGARQEILDLIEAAAELDMPAPVLDVLVGFASLLSGADFPEITVTVSWNWWNFMPVLWEPTSSRGFYSNI
jgi:RHS repeat-associated protein